ncbi:HigA family addiction module antitoxin [Amorphus sp. 3PC139-8]|uniref:HigA family addiction module antitoxin n=1 Tax=Amorphus sp. 3PC139-8 TaxID=2735676 RepID=UPI00345CEBE5
MDRNTLLLDLRPTHPGEFLREDVLPALGHSLEAIADLLRISHADLGAILDETRPLSADMALRIAKLTGTTCDSWVRMQVAFDLAHAEIALEDDLDLIPTLDPDGDLG